MVIYSFDNTAGSVGVRTALALGPKGSLYIATLDGGAHGYGSLLQLRPPSPPAGTWASAVLYSFPGSIGGADPTSLTPGPKGVLYGTTLYGGMPRGTGIGTVFKLSPPATTGGAWSGRVLYAFHGISDGGPPYSVTAGPGGILYGTVHSCCEAPSVVFQLTPPASPGGSWTETALASVGTDFKCGPDSPLIVRNGNLYGTTCQTGGGIVFELLAPSVAGGAWTYNPLYTFTNGQVPGGVFVMTGSGTIFGATINPSYQQPGGTIYEVTMK